MKKSEFTIGFCYNVHPEHVAPEDEERYAEFDSIETVNTVAASIRELGFKLAKIDFDENFVTNLKKIKPDLVFNIVEGLQGEDRESQAPAIYEWLGLKYTGASPLAHSLALNKIMAKRVMEQAGVKTAPFYVFEEPISKVPKDMGFNFPMIVKLSHEGSSIGLDNNALVKNPTELINRVNMVIKKYNQPILVEKYIEGREFNQTIIGNKNLIAFPIVEIDYDYLPPHIHKFSSYEVKTTLDIPTSTICPARITKAEAAKITEMVFRANRALGIRDYSRTDLRLDKNGDVYILEINAVPGIAPGLQENNSMPKAIKTYGWTYTQMIGAIINAACERYGFFFDVESDPLPNIVQNEQPKVTHGSG
jgi:D-alanine-D-alanine ligase